jgi:hypothetical protein
MQDLCHDSDTGNGEADLDPLCWLLASRPRYSTGMRPSPKPTSSTRGLVIAGLTGNSTAGLTGNSYELPRSAAGSPSRWPPPRRRRPHP